MSAAVSLVLALAASEVAEAGHADRRCGIVSKGKRDYRVHALNVKCRPAKRGAKRYLRSRKPLSGYTCTKGGGRTKFFCKSGDRAYWGVRL